jgi:hypothetical protein
MELRQTTVRTTVGGPFHFQTLIQQCLPSFSARAKDPGKSSYLPLVRYLVTKCPGPHHDLDDFTTYDFTTFMTLRLVIDLETGFTVQK